MELKAEVADQTLFEGEGGSYLAWSTSKSPFLSEDKLGASKLIVNPFGFAPPHFADCNKIGYVVEGVCTVGMLEPNSSEEKILLIKKGDIVPVPLGVISWWYNTGDSVFEIVYLGETSKAYIPGKFTYFYVAGVLSTLGAFPTEFVAKAFDLSESDSETFTKSHPKALIYKLAGGTPLPPPNKHTNGKLYAKIDGPVNTYTEANLGLLKKVGLSVSYAKLGVGEMFGPVYTADASIQMVYVIKGTGRVQITGAAKTLMEKDVKEGEMFAVPKFYPFALIAGENGIEMFRVTTSSEPEFAELSGKKSMWNAFSLGTVQMALGVTEDFAKLLKSKV